MTSSKLAINQSLSVSLIQQINYLQTLIFMRVSRLQELVKNELDHDAREFLINDDVMAVITLFSIFSINFSFLHLKLVNAFFETFPSDKFASPALLTWASLLYNLSSDGNQSKVEKKNRIIFFYHFKHI